MGLHTKRHSAIPVHIAEDTEINNSVKPFKVLKAGFAAQAVLSHGHHNPLENKVSKKFCSVKCVKKKHRKKPSQSTAADDDGETCHAIIPDCCSSSTVMKSDVSLKSATKHVKNVKSSLKCEPSGSISSSSLPVTCESLSLGSSLPSKRKKRKRNCTEIGSPVKLKKSRAVDSKSDEVCVVADKCSVGPVKCNFNVDQLRSALQQHGRLSDAVLQQSSLLDNKRNIQTDQKTARREQVDTNTSEINKSSLVTAGSSSDLLKERMMNKLTSARFRFVNEQMYNSTGSEAAEMFARDKDAFAIYHAGFQSQVSKWPVNPVDKMIDYINSR